MPGGTISKEAKEKAVIKHDLSQGIETFSDPRILGAFFHIPTNCKYLNSSSLFACFELSLATFRQK